GFAQLHSGGGELRGLGRPWPVNDLVGQPCKLGNPLTDVEAIRVELLSLQNGIEDTEVGGGIRSSTGYPLPVGRIVGGIGVHERVPEPALARAPVDQQMLDEKRG